MAETIPTLKNELIDLIKRKKKWKAKDKIIFLSSRISRLNNQDLFKDFYDFISDIYFHHNEFFKKYLVSGLKLKVKQILELDIHLLNRFTLLENEKILGVIGGGTIETQQSTSVGGRTYLTGYRLINFPNAKAIHMTLYPSGLIHALINRATTSSKLEKSAALQQSIATSDKFTVGDSYPLWDTYNISKTNKLLKYSYNFPYNEKILRLDVKIKLVDIIGSDFYVSKTDFQESIYEILINHRDS